MALASIITIGLSILFPFLAIRWYRRPGFPQWLSPAVMCYAIGIIVGNAAPVLVEKDVGNQLAGIGMMIALPLLLFSSNIQKNWRLAGPGLKSYAWCALAGFISTGLVAYLFRHQQDDGWLVAGMLTGIYTGGTPNMQAISMALDAPENYVVLLQAAVIVGNGIYLMLLMTVIHPFLGLFLPDFRLPKSLQDSQEEVDVDQKRATWQGISLSLGIVGASFGLTYLFTGSIQNTTLIIVFITSISILFSLDKRFNSWQNTYDQGEYFVLIFCVALGLLADFRELLGQGLPLLAFAVLSVVLMILLHWLLARWWKIDRDTVMISSTAALFGPVFIAQVTTSIHNRHLLAPGIALSLLGLAIGNYLGIGVAYVTSWLFW